MPVPHSGLGRRRPLERRFVPVKTKSFGCLACGQVWLSLGEQRGRTGASLHQCAPFTAKGRRELLARGRRLFSGCRQCRAVGCGCRPGSGRGGWCGRGWFLRLCRAAGEKAPDCRYGNKDREHPCGVPLRFGWFG